MADALLIQLDALLDARDAPEMLNILVSEGKTDKSHGMKGFTGESDFAVGSVLGYRSWKFPVENEFPLTGAFGGSWDSRSERDEAFTASCKRAVGSAAKIPDHQAPEPSCGCGFWAYWDFPRTPSVNVGGISWVRVHGILEGFGTVLIGERGFRAGRARIRGLAIDHESYRNELRSEYSLYYRGDVSVDHRRFKTEQGAALTQEMCRAYRAPQYPVQAPAFPEDAFMAVIAMLEERLEGYYPSARIFSTAASLCKYFGADPSYGTAVRRHPELAARGAAWLAEVAGQLYQVREKVWRHCAGNGLRAEQATADDELFRLRDAVMHVKEELDNKERSVHES